MAWHWKPKLHDVCRRVLKNWYWINGVGVITFALHFEVKKLPKRELKKHFNEELEKNVEDKNSINTSTSTQFAAHTWQIIGLKRVMLLRTRINWRSLLETVTLSDWSIFSEKHAQRREENLNHLHWTTFNGASLGRKKNSEIIPTEVLNMTRSQTADFLEFQYWWYFSPTLIPPTESF